MDRQSYVRFNKDFFVKPGQGGLIALSPDQKDIYILKGIADYVYKRCDGKKKAEKIIDDIVSEFDVDRDTAEQDLSAFLKQVSMEDPPLFIFSKKPA